jgi:hypothetical protein
VTIKYGKGYEETWAVFNGQVGEVREDIMSYFGIDPENSAVANLTPSELVVNVTNLAHGKGNAAALLGGVVIGSQPATATSAPASPKVDEGQQPSGSDPWAAAAASTPATPAANPMLALIEAVPDVPALQRLWAENQAAFQDAEVMAAWKAKGKALQQAA